MPQLIDHLIASLEARNEANGGFRVGNQVTWNSEAGHVSGRIVAIHRSPFTVNGYTHHASEDEPQYEIKSSKTDHVAFHKASSLHHVAASTEALVKGRHKFKTLAAGTEVTWHYRGAIGHGTIEGVHKLGTSSANTLYSIREHDHHVSKTGSHEKPVVFHYGSALTVVG